MIEFLNTNGQTYKVNLAKYSKGRKNVSSGHTRARELIQALYPMFPVYEEVPVKCGRQTLYADFIIPDLKMVVEVHGIQHYEYVAHFHGSAPNFSISQTRDRKKANWCEVNELELVVLDDRESEEQWRIRLQS